jgi:hypothetical protein
MYSRFVQILKFLQLLGYIGSLIFAIAISLTSFSINSGVRGVISSGVSFLVIALFLCFWIYMATQTPIAIVDILNRIEINTRNLRSN